MTFLATFARSLTASPLLAALLAVAAVSGCDSGGGPDALAIQGSGSSPPRGAIAFSATGGSGGGYVWSLATSASGGTIGADGGYTAGPTGEVSDVVRVVDSEGNVAVRAVSVTAGVSLAPATASAPPRGTVALIAGGGSGGGYVWSLATNASGGTIAQDGTYTAGATGGVTDVVEVVDSLGNAGSREVEVGAGVSIAPATAGTAPRGTVAFTASGGGGAYVWSLATNGSGGSITPDGLYTAGETGDASDVVQAVDLLGNSAEVTVAVGPGVSIAGGTSAPPLGSIALAASGGSGTGFAWRVATDGSGASISPDGLYTAGAAGGVSDVVEVEDSLGNVAVWTIEVGPGVSIAPLAASAAPRGSIPFVAAGGSGAGYVWRLATNGSGGSISQDGVYTAGATGDVSDVVEVEDALGNVAARTVSVGPGVSIAGATGTPPKGSLALEAAGGSGGGYSWSFATNLSGGSISAAGLYTAGATGDVSDVVRVEDALGNSALWTVRVGPGVSATPPTASIRPRTSLVFAASGGSGTGFTWSLATNASGGAITPGGAYTAGPAGNVSDVVQVADSLGNVALAVVELVPTPVPTPPEADLPPIAGRSDGYDVIPSAGMIPPDVTTVPVPRPIGGSVVDEEAAIRLGKALFWDVQTGSDGLTACATCHARAGTDARTRATVHPGPDLAFQVVSGPTATFTLATFTADDRVGSAGVLSRQFGAISADPSDPVDVCTPLAPADPAQALIDAAGERLVTGRNAPTTVGAVFNRDNFWDGRARHEFNGQNPIGRAGGPGPYVLNASLASQAVGPPLSDVEMSCAGRPFNGPNGLGAKLVPRTPLAFQQVHPQDSALGPLANAAGNGLDCGFPDRLCTYADLIAAAFGTNGLSGDAAVEAYVADFANIFGQAIQAYEATLVPDRTPYDLGLLTANQIAGLNALRDKDCTTCHAEPEFTDATVRFFATGPANANGSDKGYHNIGASPTAEDLGRAGSPGGTDGPSPNNAGAFKTPTLRNVKLTAPYMHHGAVATLPDVLELYDGQGQFPNAELDERAVGAGINDRDLPGVIDFLRNGLTDCRVEHDVAPFDHPSLLIPNGPSLPARGANGDGTALCP